MKCLLQLQLGKTKLAQFRTTEKFVSVAKNPCASKNLFLNKLLHFVGLSSLSLDF